MGNVILEVKDLKVSFYKRRREGQAVRDVNFTLEEGQTLGIIGESGSGKSVSGMSVMGLVPSIGGKIRSGEIIYEGTDLLKDTPHNCAKTSRVIFGDPKFREKAQFKRTVCTRNKPRYATFIRLRARYKFASANSVQQC